VSVEIELLYFDGCPHWEAARTRLAEALVATGNAGTPIRLRRIDTDDDVRTEGFAGSPTIRIDGTDPFAPVPGEIGGLICRRYHTDTGPQGAPTVAQLMVALRRAEATGHGQDAAGGTQP
jgi:hypothetical protein